MAHKFKTPPTVTLVSPEGVEVTASTPGEVINLVYGRSYRPKSGSAADAIDAVTTPAASSADAQAVEPVVKGGGG